MGKPLRGELAITGGTCLGLELRTNRRDHDAGKKRILAFTVLIRSWCHHSSVTKNETAKMFIKLGIMIIHDPEPPHHAESRFFCEVAYVMSRDR
jgi:hypothetical protein